MKKKDIVAKALQTVNKLVEADGIPLNICDDFRVLITMVQRINQIEFITVNREFNIDKVPESATVNAVSTSENIYRDSSS
jgi:hypothetical protein|tara:strand:- start:115 stop:354 length:240 start_codon:yes stop_codon:yes gene_type:complete